MINPSEKLSTGKVARCVCIPTQPATFDDSSATGRATVNATITLKAASLLVLQRNQQRNSSATTPEKQRNFHPEKTGEKLRPVAPVARPVAHDLRAEIEAEALTESFEERAGILEFDGGLSRGQAEESAFKMVFCSTCRHHRVPDPHRLHLLECAIFARGGARVQWASTPVWCDQWEAKRLEGGS